MAKPIKSLELHYPMMQFLRYYLIYKTDIGCLVYKELNIKSIYIIWYVIQGKKEIYCVQPC